jgi:molybdenum cofactor cytidylyltransferase
MISGDDSPPLNLTAANIAVVVLAAGRSSRMGAQSKLLLPWRDGEPIVRHVVQAALGWQPLETVVVVRPDLFALAGALAGLPVRLVGNPRWPDGMGTSLAAGIAALGPTVGAALVLLGDSPGVDPAIIAALVAAYKQTGQPVAVPFYGDEPGPPTLFARPLFPDLLRLQGDAGGRLIVRHYPDHVARVDFPAAARPPDIDTPEDYQAALNSR